MISARGLMYSLESLIFLKTNGGARKRTHREREWMCNYSSNAPQPPKEAPLNYLL
uniref:Uncharacterized protein n=1 Tax=Anguilla anguilla TaxID=7936 RepID=A0A0E9R2S5_ANGAN